LFPAIASATKQSSVKCIKVALNETLPVFPAHAGIQLNQALDPGVRRGDDVIDADQSFALLSESPSR